MPTKPRIPRERILEEAFGLVREKGADALTARNLAGRIGCSTQPILYHFADMKELEQAVYQRADAFHTGYILNIGPEEHPLLQIGMNYIRFAAEEPQLFRFLFQTDHFAGRSLEQLVSAPAAAPLIEQFALDGDKERAGHRLLMLFVWVHGYACLSAGNKLAADPDELKALLTELFLKLEG